MNDYRIGFGEDAHALVAGRALVIGGVRIESPYGALAHSDGDALLHALADALLSAFALGDIGNYFPPSSPEFRDIESTVILERVLELLHDHTGSFQILNLSAVVTLDKPKLGPYRAAIQERLSSLLKLSDNCVGIGFKTSEGLAPAHVQAKATVLVRT